MRMEGMSGVELTAAALERRPDLVCVLMTAFASYENAVEAIKAGAYRLSAQALFRRSSWSICCAGFPRIWCDLRRENRRLRKAVTTAEARHRSLVSRD